MVQNDSIPPLPSQTRVPLLLRNKWNQTSWSFAAASIMMWYWVKLNHINLMGLSKLWHSCFHSSAGTPKVHPEPCKISCTQLFYWDFMQIASPAIQATKLFFSKCTQIQHPQPTCTWAGFSFGTSHTGYLLLLKVQRNLRQATTSLSRLYFGQLFSW